MGTYTELTRAGVTTGMRPADRAAAFDRDPSTAGTGGSASAAEGAGEPAVRS